jgi:soluble lytic murein transglycosylase-like protein
MPTNTLSRGDLIALARATAEVHQLDAALVCAICEQESAWNPWAIRYEPAFERHYIHPIVPSSPSMEDIGRAVSWGPMQVLGETAREFGFQGKFLSELSDPITGLEFGCRILAHKIAIAKGDLEKALLLWNGGSNLQYPDQVFGRVSNYGPVKK